jgi:hypothetical protein
VDAAGSSGREIRGDRRVFEKPVEAVRWWWGRRDLSGFTGVDGRPGSVDVSKAMAPSLDYVSVVDSS